jgi:hypothetical protein
MTQTVLAQQATEEIQGTVVLILSLFLTFTMFMAINIVQVGLRALITDNCTQLEQSKANTWAGRHVNFAGALAYLVAYLDLPRHLEGFGNTRFARASIPTTMYLAISITITCFYTPDQAQKPSTSCTRRRVTTLQVLRSALFGSSSQIRTVCLVQFFSWLGWFPFLFYIVTYEKNICFLR